MAEEGVEHLHRVKAMSHELLELHLDNLHLLLLSAGMTSSRASPASYQ